jgi:glycerol-3-phosphate dehydrogenase subunit C
MTIPDIDPSQYPIESTLDRCIKCNICVTKCPVTRVTDLFPGPKYEAPQAGRFRNPQSHSPDNSVDYCSGCRVCNMVCPTGVKIAEMNARARAHLVSDGKVSFKYRLRNNLIARTGLIGKLGQPVAPFSNLMLSNGIVRKGMQFALGIHAAAPLPVFSRQRFTSWFRNHPRPVQATRKVVYFHGCATEYYEPRVGRAAVHVLEANNFEVIVPEQGCCGLPLLSNGEFPAARRYHASNVSHLVEYAKRGIPIVGTSTSCTLTLKEEAPELLDYHQSDVKTVAQNTFDINEFLLNLLYLEEMSLDLKSIPRLFPYHAPCQYRAHRLGIPALEILRLIPDLTIIESHADCCGIAGTYGYKVEKYQISMDVGAQLFNFIREADNPIVVCDSETCRWQITHATGKPAIHPIELLAAAYGFPVEDPLATII